MTADHRTESRPEPNAWCFGAFLIDCDRRELRRGDDEIALQPRVFDLLVYLVRHRDRAVDKDELQSAVWPGMVITETALTRAVMKARKAVGDDASRQQVIKTVHGHGYRFVADVVPAERPPVAAADSVAETTHAGVPSAAARDRAMAARRVRRSLWSAGLVVALVLAWFAWHALKPSPPLDPGTRVAVLPLIDETGNPELTWTRLGLMSYVSGMLGDDGALAMVSDGSVASLAENLGWHGELDEEQGSDLVEKLRSAFGASHVLAMQLTREGSALRMNFTLLGPDGRLQKGTMVGDAATDLAEGVAQGVYGLLLGKRRAGDAPLVSSDPFNNEAFARGMDLSLQGRCAEAIRFFRIIIEQEPGLFAPRYEFAHCQRILGAVDEAETLLNELIAEQRAIDAGRPLARALMTRGVLYNRSGRLDLAEADHREALKLAEALGEHELAARILQNLSIVMEDRGEFEQAEEYLDLAVLAYEAAGRETLPGHIHSARANLHMDRGELAEAQGDLDAAIAAFRAVGDRRNEAMMLNNTGYLLRAMGRPNEAEDYHLRSLAIREAIGDRVGVGRVQGQLSAVYAAQGRWAEAAGAAESAHAIAQETKDRLFEATSLAQWAAAERGAGNLGAAREHYRQSRSVFVAIQDRMRTLQVDLALARLDLLEGQVESSQATAVDVLDEARRAELMQPEIEAMELLGEIARARGDLSAAIEEYRLALARVRESSWAGKEIDLLVALLNAQLDAGDRESAAPLAGALAGMEPSVPALKARARFAFETGQDNQAVTLMEEARALAGPAWDADSEALLAGYRGR